VRADVDAFLLDLLEDREFTARDFGELPNGVCRIAAPVTHELALTLPHWRECLRPIAANLAQAFRESLVNKGAVPRTLAAKSGNKRRNVPSSERSPLLATPRKDAQTEAGHDPRRSADVNGARGEAIGDGHRRNRSWAREHPDQRDEAWFQREVVPKLDVFPLKEIGKATGLSLAACSRIGAGAKVRIHATGIACSRWSKPGTEPQGRTSLAADTFSHRGSH
jgi:hypothetical protein